MLKQYTVSAVHVCHVFLIGMFIMVALDLCLSNS